MSKRDFNAISISSDSDDERLDCPDGPDGKIFKNEIDISDQPSTSFNTDASDGKQKSLSELLKARLGYSRMSHKYFYSNRLNKFFRKM